MLKPDTVLVQEIKVVPAKAKIMDMVAIRHPSSVADHRTTLILLCEDGSLRIYMAAMEQTGVFTLKRYLCKCDTYIVVCVCNCKPA
jgi:E3 ubiquitin-protein ligase UBR4